MASAPVRHLTYADLDALPDQGRYEVWDGVLLEMPAAGHRHSVIAGLIVTAINNFAYVAGLGTASVTDGGYVLARDPLILYIPDVAFVRAGRLPEDDSKVLELAPDLVMEVVSPTDRMTEVQDKVATYLAAGVQLVWVVLPSQQHVHVYVSEQLDIVRVMHADDELDGGNVLPGFRLPLRTIFG